MENWSQPNTPAANDGLPLISCGPGVGYTSCLVADQVLSAGVNLIIYRSPTRPVKGTKNETQDSLCSAVTV